MCSAPAAARRLPLDAYLAHGARAGIAWTQLRERLIRLLWSAPEPLGAYQVAERLSVAGRTTHPTSVYRLLARFEEAGLIVPVVSWRRYLLSPNPAVRLWALLLCRACQGCAALDLSDRRAALDRRLSARAFDPRSYCVEWQGLCRACRRAAP